MNPTIAKVGRRWRLVDRWGGEWLFRLIILSDDSQVFRARLVKPPGEYCFLQNANEALTRFVGNLAEHQPYLSPRALEGFESWRKKVLG